VVFEEKRTQQRERGCFDSSFLSMLFLASFFCLFTKRKKKKKKKVWVLNLEVQDGVRCVESGIGGANCSLQRGGKRAQKVPKSNFPRFVRKKTNKEAETEHHEKVFVCAHLGSLIFFFFFFFFFFFLCRGEDFAFGIWSVGKEYSGQTDEALVFGRLFRERSQVETLFFVAIPIEKRKV
jgi:hypothetical protein